MVFVDLPSAPAQLVAHSVQFERADVMFVAESRWLDRLFPPTQTRIRFVPAATALPIVAGSGGKLVTATATHPVAVSPLSLMT